MLIACDYIRCVTGYFKPNKCITMKKEKFKVWKKIEFGNFNGLYALLSKIGSLNIKIDFPFKNESYEELKDSFRQYNDKSVTYSFVKITPKELGIKQKSTYTEIVKMANKLGLSICFKTAVFEIILEYLEQPEDEKCIIAMDTIINMYGDEIRFGISNKGGEKYIFCFRPGSNQFYEITLAVQGVFTLDNNETQSNFLIMS